MLTKRTNILFEEQSWKKLTTLARSRGTSVGELVRQAVNKEYSDSIRQEQVKQAVENINKFREKYGQDVGGEDSVKIIRRMREERYGKAHLRRLGSY